MRWLYGFAVATAVFGVTLGGFFSGINATDPAVGQAAQPVICVSGCSGGGGAVFGPTATGSAAGNPPVLMGGTVDGTATGAVDNWKVSAGIGFVNCANCSGSGVSQTDEATFTAGTSLFAPGGGFYQTTATSNPLTNGQQGLWQMTANRAGFVNPRNSSGTEIFTSGAAGYVQFPSAQAVTATLQASATTAIGKVDPNTIATWGLGTLGGAAAPTNAMAVAGEYLSSAPTYTTGQTGALQMTAAGSLHTTVDNTNANTEWNADGVAATTNGAPTSALGFLYNGTTVDRARSGSVTGAALTQLASQYPSGATAITASATGTTAATTATLAGTSGKTTYICSYSIRANATAAATVLDTVTGVITATMSSELWVAPAASGLGVDEQIFSPCVPASATNTDIAVVSGAPGTGGVVSVHATGYQL